MTNAFQSLIEMPDDLPFAPSVPDAPRQEHQPAAATPGEMRGLLTSVSALTRFITAGHAIVTVVSRKSGNRLTFKFARPEPEPGRDRPIWVSVLTGPENERDYNFLGTIWDGANGFSYRHSAKSRVTETAASVQLIVWLCRALNNARPDLFTRAEFWHEGRCGRCGRRLTVPESIASGFGPECINYV